MKVTRPNPDVLVLEHGLCAVVLIVFAVVGGVVVWAFTFGALAGLGASIVAFGFAWLASRRVERVRAVFDKRNGRVDIRRRTARRGVGRASYDLAEIGGVDVEETGAGRHRLFQLVLVNPTARTPDVTRSTFSKPTNVARPTRRGTSPTG